MAAHDSSLFTRLENRMLAQKLRAHGLPYNLIAEVLGITLNRAFKDARHIVPDKQAAPAPALTMADAVAFLHAEGFDVIAIAPVPTDSPMQATRWIAEPRSQRSTTSRHTAVHTN